jgi:hypothetical protein
VHFTLSDLITDISQNGAESGAKLVELEIRETPDEFRFTVHDNGKGMEPDELKRALDPFITDGIKHPNRKVGLGLPFLIQTAEQAGGGWDVQSEKGKGTKASAWFDLHNVDTPPVGDLPGMFRTIILFEGPEEIRISRSRTSVEPVGSLEPGGSLEYELCKSELLDALGDLEDANSLVLLARYLRSMEEPDEEDDEESDEN